MAETKKTTEERVPLLIPLLPSPKADQTVYISVNFENIIVQRGQTVMVKPEFKKAWEESQRAEYEAVAYASSEEAKFNE